MKTWIIRRCPDGIVALAKANRHHPDEFVAQVCIFRREFELGCGEKTVNYHCPDGFVARMFIFRRKFELGLDENL